MLHLQLSDLELSSPVLNVHVWHVAGPILLLSILLAREASGAIEVTQSEHAVAMTGQVSAALAVSRSGAAEPMAEHQRDQLSLARLVNLGQLAILARVHPDVIEVLEEPGVAVVFSAVGSSSLGQAQPRLVAVSEHEAVPVTILLKHGLVFFSVHGVVARVLNSISGGVQVLVPYFERSCVFEGIKIAFPEDKESQKRNEHKGGVDNKCNDAIHIHDNQHDMRDEGH